MYSLMPQEHKVTIDYGNLDQEQKEHVKSLLDEVKPEYLVIQKKISFTNDELPRMSNEANKFTAGLSDFKGKSIIKYTEDENLLKSTICHELLHSFMRWDEYSHTIIKDLEQYNYCFKNSKELNIRATLMLD